jgi:sugar phosphate permease
LADTFGWRVANFVLAGVSIVIALSAFIFIKEGNFQKIQKEERRGESLVDSVMTILRNPQSWIYGLYGCAMYVPLSGFADLWGTPFLMESYQVERTIAAGTMSIFYVGLSIGAPLWSVLATRLKSYRKGMMYSAMVSVFCLTAVIYLPVSFSVLKVLMFIAGFSVGGQFIAFAGVTQLNPAHRTGTAAGVHNMLCMLSGAAMQPLIGKCLDLCLAADQCGIGTRYTHEYFLKSLALVPLCVLVAVILAYFMKETFPVQEKT